MRKNALRFAALAATPWLAAQAAGASAGPVLTLTVGELDHAGKAFECRLYINHPELKGREQQLDGWIAAAVRAPFSEERHITATVPSVEYAAYAHQPGKKRKLARKKVVLSLDHGTLKHRTGPEAEELIALTKRLCRENP